MNHQVAGKFRKLDILNVPSRKVGVYVEPPFWKNIASIHALRQLDFIPTQEALTKNLLKCLEIFLYV